MFIALEDHTSVKEPPRSAAHAALFDENYLPAIHVGVYIRQRSGFGPEAAAGSGARKTT